MSDDALHLLLIERIDPGELIACGLGDLSVACLGVDVDAPAGKLSSQADILATTADCLGELIVGDDELHGVGVLVDEHPGDVGRSDRVHDEPGRIRVEGNDVDGLSAKLLDHRLYAGALEADAGADGIDITVHGGHGDLGAVARLACTGFDPDDALVDLRNLKLEELHQQAWMRTREHHLG